MALVADGSMDVQTILVLGVLAERLHNAIDLRALSLETAVIDLKQLAEDTPSSKRNGRIIAQLCLFLVQGSHVDLGAGLAVHHQEPECEDRRQECLAILPRKIQITQSILASTAFGSLESDDVREDKELPVLGLEELTRQRPLVMFELTAEPADLEVDRRVEVQVGTLQVIEPPLTSQPYVPA